MYPGIVLTHLLFGVGLGFVMHRSDFCMAGAFRDLFLTGDFFRMRALILLVCVTSVLLYLGRISGLIASYPPSFYGSPSPVNILGGLVFGVGMVLAGGCVMGTLYKMGSGNLVSVFAFAGLLLGILLFAVLYPLYRPFAEAMSLPGDYTSIEHVVGSAAFPVVTIVPVALFFLFRGKGQGRWKGKSYARGYLDPWKAGLVISAIIMASFIIVGRPLSVITGFTKLAACLTERLFPGHSLSPSAFGNSSIRLLYGMVVDRQDKSVIDPVLVTQVPMILGVVFGAFLSSLLLGEFSLPPFPPNRQLISGFTGGVLMGVGSLAAEGCNVWHIMGGLPVFALQSILFVCGVFLGAFVGSRLLAGVILGPPRYITAWKQ